MGKTPKSTQDQPLDFEASVKSLQTIIEKLETDETNLQDSLKEFETGVQLVRSAQQTLTEAEQRVRLLLKDGEDPATGDFHLSENSK